MEDKSQLPVRDAWTPASWRVKANPYAITYSNPQAANEVLDKLAKVPALVTESEIADLKKALRQVALGKAFIWQGGDCAELFDYCEDSMINARIKLLAQLGLIFSHITQLPTLLLGRIAGQYGKPRNSLTEFIGGVEVPKFYGDNINGYDGFKRDPDPMRMLSAYFHSSSTLNRIRSTLSSGGSCYDDMEWELGPTRERCATTSYSRVVEDINIGLSKKGYQNLPFIFTSHEGLYLHYEQALTRPWNPHNIPQAIAQRHEPRTKWFNSSAHFIWIGDKTRQLDGSHVEYFRGLENPIGIKVGPSISGEELVLLLNKVNPEKECAKVTLISRLGEKGVAGLRYLVKAVQDSGHQVIWQCDPLHGNTRITADGVRTRNFSSIVDELLATLEIHKACNSFLGGVHVEMTPDDVIECVGGSEDWTDNDLFHKYKTKCDPRLNKKQSLELAFLAAVRYQAVMGKAIPHPQL